MKVCLLLGLVFLICSFSFSQEENNTIRRASRKQSKIKNEIKTVDGTNIQKNSDATYNVWITVTHYYPYCGGAYPDHEDLNNFSRISNTIFILHNFGTKQNEYVRSDSTGTIKLNLPNGKYGIKETYKDISFDEFLKRYYQTPQMYYQSADTACYKNWWMSHLTEFEINDSIQQFRQDISTSDACFTGNNPCLFYTGPYPP